MPRPVAEDFSPEEFYEGLVRHRLIIPVGAQGVFGRGGVFENVLEHVNAALSRVSAGDRAEVYTFPPVIDRGVLERVHYMESFPHLCGAVCSFSGGEPQARALSARINAGAPWGDLLGMTDVVLNPAACYPVYPSLAGYVPAEGRRVTMLNWVYRHEPSPEPTRMQSFRVREFVCVGTRRQVIEWRERWLRRAMDLLASLDLAVTSSVAADAFFGRTGKVLAAGQMEQKLKFEIVVPVISRESPTALCSFNFHQEYFGKTFGIRTLDDDTANSACVGFGLERIVMALFKTHGFDPVQWPGTTRERLCL